MPTPAPTDAFAIRRLFEIGDVQVQSLAELLVDCVDGGASVSFLHPLPLAKAASFWRRVGDGVARGERALLVAEDAAGIVGTVQLVLEQPDNQLHRADLAKRLVHRRARRRGLGAALMRAAEALGRDCGKTLVVLDTVTGSDAERLYTRLGWQRSGVIPGYALLPRGDLCANDVLLSRARPVTYCVRRGTTTRAMPPRMATAAARSRSVGASPSRTMPPKAASTGTLSCTVAALVVFKPGSAVYQTA